MCGILGYIGPPDAVRAVDLRAAVEALRHRGPDWQGTYVGLAKSGLTGCALTNTRLAILDLSPRGALPMSTEDGRYTIVYNGEVYNFREVRDRLGSTGVTFYSESDAEVALKAYATWGASCMERLRGMFAFGIWDAQDGTLFLARDRLGVKPLYISQCREGFAFASEIRALLATGLADRRLSAHGVLGYLASGSVPEPHTILEGVFALPPGHTLELATDGARPRLSRYWALPSASRTRSSLEEAAEELAPLLREAVAMRLVADVPVGIFLSGGVDSSAVTALAAAASQGPVECFTATFDEEGFDEGRFATEVASRYGCRLNRVHLSQERAAGELSQALLSFDQPSADGVNTYFVSKAAREAGLRVALSGLGGDEVFAGYPAFRRQTRLLQASRTAGFLLDPLRRLTGSPLVPGRIRKAVSLATAVGDPAATYVALRSAFPDALCERLLTRELWAEATLRTGSSPLLELLGNDKAEAPFPGDFDPINDLSRRELSGYLRNTLLRDLDSTSMAHSLEVREPLLDHKLVEAALGVPGSLKLDPRINKPLLVASVPGLPEAAVARRKMGFALPMDRWLRGPLRSWLEEQLLGEPIRGLSALNPGAVESVLRGYRRGERFISHSPIFGLAALVHWARLHRVTA